MGGLLGMSASPLRSHQLGADAAASANHKGPAAAHGRIARIEAVAHAGGEHAVNELLPQRRLYLKARGDVDAVDDGAYEGPVAGLKRGNKLGICAAGAAGQAERLELLAVHAVGAAEAEWRKRGLQHDGLQTFAVVYGVLHGNATAHGPAEYGKCVPAQGFNQLVGEITHTAGRVHRKRVAAAEAAQVRGDHKELALQPLHERLVKS